MRDVPKSSGGSRRILLVSAGSLVAVSVVYCFFAAQRAQQPVWQQHTEKTSLLARCSKVAAAAAGSTAAWPSNEPSWFNRESPEQLFSPPRQSRTEDGGTHRSQWDEDVYAYQHFFNGLVSGSYLEVGGLDGVTYSNSLWYHQHMAWRGLLVEGSPKSYASLVKNRPFDITANAAICSNRTTVHYAQHDIGAVSGIIEFMSEGFKRHWYKQLDAAAKIAVPCVPMRDILSHYNIRHVDLFSLDVEGGELMVLESIDFDCFSFDVAVVELDGTNKPKDDRVVSLLADAGYAQYSHVYNNTWFVRQGFLPSPAP